MDNPRVRLGELLVRAGLITARQLDEALAEQRRVGKRLGSLLVELGLVSETQVTQILSQQLSVPWVSLHHIDFSRELLELVPIDLVERFCLVPIYVRRVRGLGDALYVAMDDPTNTQALAEVAERSGLHVRAMIAPPSDVRAAIHAYYGIGEAPQAPAPARRDAEVDVPTDIMSRSEIEARAAVTAASISPKQKEPEKIAVVEPPKLESVRNAEDLRSIAPAKRPAAREATMAAGAEPQAVAAAGGAAQVIAPALAAAGGVGPAAAPAGSGPSAATEAPPSSARPNTKQGAERLRRALADSARADAKTSRRLVALTLLDGTTIRLPGKDKAEEGEAPAVPEDRLTARDLVAALRASAHGADTSDVLGDNVRWERLFASLLSLLLKKHLISDWEFVEELKKG
jgi:type IV pilus assembly protein PilB